MIIIKTRTHPYIMQFLFWIDDVLEGYIDMRPMYHGSILHLLSCTIYAVFICMQRPLNYRQTSSKHCTLVGNRIVDQSDVVGASPVGAAPTTSSFST